MQPRSYRCSHSPNIRCASAWMSLTWSSLYYAAAPLCLSLHSPLPLPILSPLPLPLHHYSFFIILSQFPSLLFFPSSSLFCSTFFMVALSCTCSSVSSSFLLLFFFIHSPSPSSPWSKLTDETARLDPHFVFQTPTC